MTPKKRIFKVEHGKPKTQKKIQTKLKDKKKKNKCVKTPEKVNGDMKEKSKSQRQED